MDDKLNFKVHIKVYHNSELISEDITFAEFFSIYFT
jgi:hypothetical protein